jgi:hypothetical protein
MIKFLQFLLIITACCFSSAKIQAGIPNTEPVKTVLEQQSFMFAPSFNTVSPEENDTKFVLYINEGILYIKYGKPQELVNGEVILFNLLGLEITRKKLENIAINQVKIPVQNTCYIVKINYSGKVHTQKVVASGQ